jgi:hypothetical protein
MHTPFTSRRRWAVAFLSVVVALGTVGLTPGHAQSIPEAPIVIVPVAPLTVSMPGIRPPLTMGITGKSRNGMIWSKSGRADVDIAIDEHHGRAVVP